MNHDTDSQVRKDFMRVWAKIELMNIEKKKGILK